MGVWGVVLVVCVFVGVEGVVLCRCVCMCDLLIFLHEPLCFLFFLGSILKKNKLSPHTRARMQ